VDSQEGKGTNFHFTMILNSAEGSPSDPPLPNLAQDVLPRDRHCLVIEHSEFIRQHICRDLTAVGLQSHAVADFPAARRILRLNDYAVMIVDESLARSDAFVREIGQTSPLSRVIVIANLGHSMNIDAENVVTTLVKPIFRWRLFKALGQGLTKSPKARMKETDLETSVDGQRRGLATLAFRHPLRILVFRH
jgi:DNA-binding NtrC family response regulator